MDGYQIDWLTDYSLCVYDSVFREKTNSYMNSASIDRNFKQKKRKHIKPNEKYVSISSIIMCFVQAVHLWTKAMGQYPIICTSDLS